ncbi:hypothetical protein A2U01_0033754 [Trifolium medium]|uniref:Uncharacterized protein n=1 Tax=Trifolium medium TaxID=97028 RepID=A0A392PME2_9FABA|nr:hypothetical protein [Trifolium medium]
MGLVLTCLRLRKEVRAEARAPPDVVDNVEMNNVTPSTSSSDDDDDDVEAHKVPSSSGPSPSDSDSSV